MICHPLFFLCLFLGVPIEGEAFIRQFTEDTPSKFDDMLSKLSRLQSSLGKFLNLRACFGACCATHLLCSLDLNVGTFLVTQSSHPFCRAIDDLLQRITSDEQYTLACLASRRGGLGLKNPTWTHGLAFLASCFTYAASAETLSSSFWQELWHGARGV